jgi:hypothetical protein
MSGIADQPAGNTGRLRDMTRKNALRRLFELSELHLWLAFDELWERWEDVATLKSKLYEIISRLGGAPMDSEELKTSARILDLEQRMISVLKAKKKRDGEEIREHMDSEKPIAPKAGLLLRIRC